jgi:dienelactone hydrolase
VAFTSGDLALAGMLFLPAGEGPFPAAVIIHGSGPSRRDNAWYLTIAERLQAEGIAVFLPNKRGSEKSEGDWRTATLADLATDTEAAVARLRGMSDIAPDAIGLVGMSQGGWIAPLVASRDPGLAYVVSMSGAAVTSDEQLLFEEENNIRQMGTYRFVARLIAPIVVRRIQRGDYWPHLAGFDPLPYWREV